MKNELVVFKKNKPRVIAALKKGNIDFVDGTITCAFLTGSFHFYCLLAFLSL